MIDLVYKTVTTVINKENNGYVSPDEFNKIANLVQEKIFKGYFEDHNTDIIRGNSGIVSKGYGNLPFNQRQKIGQFSAEGLATPIANSFFQLPQDLYLIEDDGLIAPNGSVVEEVERRDIGYLSSSLVSPTECYPVYSRYADRVKVFPASITEDLEILYIRKPKAPKWTYFVGQDGKEFFNPTLADYQDFELHDSEFSNLVLEILMFFGINLRESDVVKIASSLASTEEQKENNQ